MHLKPAVGTLVEINIMRAFCFPVAFVVSSEVDREITEETASAHKHWNFRKQLRGIYLHRVKQELTYNDGAV